MKGGLEGVSTLCTNFPANLSRKNKSEKIEKALLIHQ